MSKKPRPSKDCPACGGQGVSCCITWAMARVNAGDDLEFSVGLPNWPLMHFIEMNFCPFCGKRFSPDRGDPGPPAPRSRRRASRKGGRRLEARRNRSGARRTRTSR